MLITKLERIGRRKFRVFIDYDISFTMNESELALYDMDEGIEITEEAFGILRKEKLVPGAKRKAMDTLKSSDKSEAMVRRKLLEDFPEDVTDEAIGYLYSFHYLDDERYARNYYLSHKDSKSYLGIVAALSGNGVSKETILAVVGDLSEDISQDTSDRSFVRESETQAICIFIRKKGIGREDSLSYEEKSKLMQALFRKGFSQDAVRDAFDYYFTCEE